MSMDARREKIVNMVNAAGSLGFSKIKEQFPNLSEMTLRRDLEALDRSNRLIRTHGGARSVEVLIGTDDLYARRSTRNAEGKVLIAEKAAALMQENTTVFLDSGSTCTELARHLGDRSAMVCTASVTCAYELSRVKKMQVQLLGGHLNGDSLSVNGVMTVRDILEINFHTAFIGVTGYMRGRGFTCGSPEECELKRAAIRRAERVILLMDGSKDGITSTFTFSDGTDVDMVITDGKLNEKTVRELERIGMEVL